jgi:hypothetical protein
MIILGVDFETAGTPDSPPFVPTEIGWAYYCTNQKRIVSSGSTLIRTLEPVREEFLVFTNLSNELIASWGRLESAYADKLYALPDAIMVWNGLDFDIPLLFDKANHLVDVPVIDLKHDGGFGYKLSHTCADYSILLGKAHTALADVMAMFSLLEASDLDPDYLLYLAKSPRVLVQANVSYQERMAAKEAGFSWNPRATKWEKKMRKVLLEDSNWSFECQIVEIDF